MEHSLTFDGNRSNNADEDRIEIVEYNPAWPELFETEKLLLQFVLPEQLEYTIEHVGSTAIPGMPARPVIDILIICDDQESWNMFKRPLKAEEYILWEESPRTDRMFFVCGVPPYGKPLTYHLYVRHSEDTSDMLTFRDYLRQNPEEARQYARLKKELGHRNIFDSEAYTNSKSEFIETVLLHCSH